MSETPTDLRTHLAAAIEGWEKESRALDSKISALVVEKDALSKRMDAARVLLADTPDVPPASADAERKPVGPNAKTPKPPKLTIIKQWQDQILAIVNRYELGCTYAELRAELARSPVGARLVESDKSYQRAMSRLGSTGAIERAYGRVFTPEAFAAFKRGLNSGAVSPILSQPMVRSPMGEAILEIVYNSPGVRSKQIIAELRRNPEFNAALTPHETGAFNIIARLTRRHQIAKRDDGGCFPGSAFPYDLLGLTPNGERVPNSSAVGTLSAGEGATSPIENQPALRLIS